MVSTDKSQALSTGKLILMAVVAVDSLRAIPSNAAYGYSLIFYYALAVALFYIPTALVTAELATSIKREGGAYAWVDAAFGKRHAFISAWLQWLTMLVYSPAILSFLVTTLLYLGAPSLRQNNHVIFFAVVSIFWLTATLLKKGVYVAGVVTSFCGLIGVLLPMAMIIILAGCWLISGHISQMVITDPVNFFSTEHLRFWIPLIFSLMGMEMIAIHVHRIKQPARNYPLAILIASCLILGTMIPAALAVAIVIPAHEIKLLSGVIESFARYLAAFHRSQYLPLFIIAIAVGSYGIFYTWLMAITSYLAQAIKAGNLPAIFTSKHDANQLTIMGLCVTGISALFLFFQSTEHVFWLLNVACAQFALIYYLYIFSAAIYLRYKFPKLERPFQVGRSPLFIYILSSIGILACCIALIFGFIPPQDMQTHEITYYEMSLGLIMVGGLMAGMLLYRSERGKQHTCLLNDATV